MYCQKNFMEINKLLNNIIIINDKNSCMTNSCKIRKEDIYGTVLKYIDDFNKNCIKDFNKNCIKDFNKKCVE